MIYYAGAALPLNFKHLQYAFLQDQYAGDVKQHFPDVRRLMHDFDNPIMESVSQLQTLVDSTDDQTAPRASSLFNTANN